MSARVLVNGAVGAMVPAFDRGLCYGDGLFETLRFIGVRAPLWERHMARLREGCARLGMVVPDVECLARECAAAIASAESAVVRITLTRGSGRRGYAPDPQATPTRVVAAFPLPGLDPDWYARGIRVRCCQLRLAWQPSLAGVKHLNRLEQVLARAEWSDPDILEGLLFDADDGVVGATAANVFVSLGGALATPPVDACGVAGVARAALLDALPGIEVRRITRDELMQADEIFLTSSVRGVLPVRELDGRALRVGPRARAAQAAWHRLGFPEGRA